jgi:acetyl-CoA acyltransferase
MGRHPMGEGVDPNPRFVSRALVDDSALVMGMTAENLHDRFPDLTKERVRRLRRALPGEGRQGVRQRQDPARPGAVAGAQRGPVLERGWGLATADEPPRPGTTMEDLAA